MSVTRAQLIALIAAGLVITISSIVSGQGNVFNMPDAEASSIGVKFHGVSTAGSPVQPDQDAAKLFADDCAQCHAPDGHGLMLNQPNFTKAQWQAAVSDDEMFKVIKYGREPMPFWTGLLTDAQITSLVKYIRTLAKPAASEESSTIKPSGQTTATADQCIACHQKNSDRIVGLFKTSLHFTAGKSCNSCHGGDAQASDKQSAHSLTFIGKPVDDQRIRMCSQCHRKEGIEYRASHHFSEDKRIHRADCIECHGAHTVGNPGPDFSFNYFCSGCHGLEYLPGLQEDFQKMLKMTDDVRASLDDLRSGGKTPSPEIVSRRKEIQGMIGEIVHKTDLKGGTEQIPHILELGGQLQQMITQAKSSQ